jgi:hypothetical protein
MANKRYNLAVAENFLRDFKKPSDLAKVFNHFDEFKGALTAFVKAGNEDYFKQLTDRLFEIADASGKDAIKNGVYNLLQTLLYDIDSKTILRKASAVKLFENAYSNPGLKAKSKEPVLDIRYNVEGYTPEQVYQNIDTFSSIIISRYPNLIKNVKKVWSDKKDVLNFNFNSFGHDISAHMQLEGKELVIGSKKLPQVVTPHMDGIKRKTQQTLEAILPRLPVSQQN